MERSQHFIDNRQGTNLVVDRVPGHTVDRPHMAAQHCDGFVPLDVVNVDLEVVSGCMTAFYV